MKTWQGFAGNSGPAPTTWNYDGARGWLAAKDYADATSGHDYLYNDVGRMRTNQLAQIVSGSTRLQRVYRYGTGGDEHLQRGRAAGSGISSNTNSLILNLPTSWPANDPTV